MPQVVCLRAIEKLAMPGVGITVAEISETVQLSPATVSRIVERLTSSGMVARERNTTDRRKVCISLTETGRGRLANLPPPLQETFLQRLDELELGQRKELLTSLRLLVDLMNAGELDAAPLLVPDEKVGDAV